MAVAFENSNSSLKNHAQQEIGRMGAAQKTASLFLQKFCEKDPRTAKMFYKSIGNPQNGAVFYRKQERRREGSIEYLAKKCIAYQFEIDREEAKILFNLPIYEAGQKHIKCVYNTLKNLREIETNEFETQSMRLWFIGKKIFIGSYHNYERSKESKFVFTWIDFSSGPRLKNMDRAENYLKASTDADWIKIALKIREFFASQSEKLVEKFDKYLHPKEGLLDSVLRMGRERILARLVKKYIVQANAVHALTGKDVQGIGHLPFKGAKELSQYASSIDSGSRLNGSLSYIREEGGNLGKPVLAAKEKREGGAPVEEWMLISENYSMINWHI